MGSDDTASERVSTELLETLIRPVNVSELTPWPESPWDYDVGAATVRDSTFGKLRLPVVLNGEVLYGSQIVDAERIDPKDDGHILVIDLTELGWSKERATAAVLGEMTADRQAFVDDVMLAELVTTLHDQDAVMAAAAGWEGDDIQALLDRIEQDEHNVGLNDPDDIPEPPTTEPITKPGDIWLLGPHRILCGDCRNPEHATRLLDGATINLAFTSPPYADRRKYDETSGFKPIPPDEYVEWFEPVQANVREHLADDGSWFVNIKEHCHDGQRELYVKDLTVAHVRDWGWAFIDEFCWRRSGVPGKWPNRFKNSWEPVFHFARSTQIKMRHDNVTHESDDVFDYSADNPTTPTGFISGNHVSRDGLALPGNVVDVGNAGAGRSGEHAAEFPVALPDFFVRACTDEGDTVFDPFMGSGSTILAADQNGRIGYGTELSPAYCDVIAARYERATGVKPIREATGEPVSFMDGDD